MADATAREPLPPATEPAERLRVMVLAPPVRAVGGGPAHVRNMLASPLATRCELVHFETGSRGTESPARDEPPPARLWRLVSTPFRLAAALRRQRIAVVHVNGSINHKAFWRDLQYIAVANLCGAAVVDQEHGGSLDRFCGRNPLLRRVAGAVFARCDAVVVLSSIERDAFGRLPGIRRLRVVRNAVDLSEFDALPPRAPRGDLKRLAYLGRLTREKGLFEALEALAVLASDPGLAGLELRIAGSGEAGAGLARRIEELGLGGRVRLVGPLFGPDKLRFLQDADAFLFPSYHEGLPYAVLESMAAGTPVIASRVGGIPDVVADGAEGLLIEPRDPRAIVSAVRALAADPARLRAMAENSAARARREFGLDRLAREFAELYEEVARDRGRGTRSPSGSARAGPP